MDNTKKIKCIMLGIVILLILAVTAFHFRNVLLPHAPLPAPIVIDTTGQPTQGNPTAKVHIVVFEDLKCINCARFSTTILPDIKKQYIDTGIATYTMINLAFVPGSMPAANAARCVYQQNPTLFFDYIDAIFKNQPPEDENWATVPTLMTFAAEIKGIDSDKLAACLITNPNQGFIENNLKLAMAVMKPPVSTPTVYVNGVQVSPLSTKQLTYVIEQMR